MVKVAARRGQRFSVPCASRQAAARHAGSFSERPWSSQCRAVAKRAAPAFPLNTKARARPWRRAAGLRAAHGAMRPVRRGSACSGTVRIGLPLSAGAASRDTVLAPRRGALQASSAHRRRGSDLGRRRAGKRPCCFCHAHPRLAWPLLAHVVWRHPLLACPAPVFRATRPPRPAEHPSLSSAAQPCKQPGRTDSIAAADEIYPAGLASPQSRTNARARTAVPRATSPGRKSAAGAPRPPSRPTSRLTFADADNRP